MKSRGAGRENFYKRRVVKVVSVIASGEGEVAPVSRAAWRFI